MKKTKLNGGEITAYIITLLLWLGGLTMIVLYTIAMNLPRLDNPLRNANNDFAADLQMSWLIFGSLLILLGSIISAIVLAVHGAKAEVISEKSARRQQRLALEETNELE